MAFPAGAAPRLLAPPPPHHTPTPTPTTHFSFAAAPPPTPSCHGVAGPWAGAGEAVGQGFSRLADSGLCMSPWGPWRQTSGTSLAPLTPQHHSCLLNSSPGPRCQPPPCSAHQSALHLQGSQRQALLKKHNSPHCRHVCGWRPGQPACSLRLLPSFPHSVSPEAAAMSVPRESFPFLHAMSLSFSPGRFPAPYIC